MTQPIDIRPHDLDNVRSILRAVLPPDARVWVFGSRATWTTKDSSDLDLAIDAGRPLTPQEESALRDAFEESDLPYTVDVVDMQTVSETFRAIVEQERVELQFEPEEIFTWSKQRLADLGRIVTGKTPSTADEANYGGSVPFVTPTDMDGSRIIHQTKRHLTQHGLESVRSSFIPSNAILVSCIGSDMGKAVLIECNAVTNQQINSIIPNDNVDRLFVYYNLSMRRSEIRYLAGGAAQPILNKTDFGNLSIQVPSLAEQKKISSILNGLDDKIELNRRMNETLEAMARAIFKDWFVDFGPTRAKMEGRSPYLSPDLWHLFPSSLDDEDKPKGWGQQSLAQVVQVIQRGLSPSYIEDGGVLVLNQKCVRDRRIDVTKGRRHDSSKKSTKGRVLINGDILVNSTGVGTLGRVAQIWQLPEVETIVDSHVTVVRPDKAVALPLYMGFNLIGREAEIDALGEGSTGQTELSRVRLGELSVLVPDQLVQTAFEKMTISMVERIVLNDTESRTLAQTRDLLLPKLMSGEIRIRDAEARRGSRQGNTLLVS